MYRLPELKKDSFGRLIADNKTISLDDYLKSSDEPENDEATDRLKQHPIKCIK